MNLGNPFEVQQRVIELKREDMDDLERAALAVIYGSSFEFVRLSDKKILRRKDGTILPTELMDDLYKALEDRGLVWPMERGENEDINN